jgi:hypothetical protein
MQKAEGSSSVESIIGATDPPIDHSRGFIVRNVYFSTFFHEWRFCGILGRQGMPN